MPVRSSFWLLLLGLALAGCLASPYDFRATGSDARFIEGYAYDGVGVHRANGNLEVELNAAKDTGRVGAHVEYANHAYDVVFNRFFGSDAYKGGGVHRDFVEHGATGNGSAELPAFHAYVAAWGAASMRLDGQPVRDPTTLADEWQGHLMVVRGHVRDENSGAVYKADGRSFYDPATPDDGLVNRTGAQAILQLRTANKDLVYHFEFEAIRIAKL